MVVPIRFQKTLTGFHFERQFFELVKDVIVNGDPMEANDKPLALRWKSCLSHPLVVFDILQC